MIDCTHASSYKHGGLLGSGNPHSGCPTFQPCMLAVPRPMNPLLAVLCASQSHPSLNPHFLRAARPPSRRLPPIQPTALHPGARPPSSRPPPIQAPAPHSAATLISSLIVVTITNAKLGNIGRLRKTRRRQRRRCRQLHQLHRPAGAVESAGRRGREPGGGGCLEMLLGARVQSRHR